jgi:hypothetical protein
MNFQSDPNAAAAATMSHAMRPDLVIHEGDLPAAVRAARALLAPGGDIFERGGLPVQLVAAPGETPQVIALSHHAVTMRLHMVCRPISVGKAGQIKATTFPERAARMLVDTGDGFPHLDGIAAAPMLADDGTIRTGTGYDELSSMYRLDVPTLRVPPRPGRADAEAALLVLRESFCTFPFADSPRITTPDADVVDTSQPAAGAETAFLCGLLTAIARPSLSLAPGMLITAPDVSGAGSGKGLLVNAAAIIAFGSQPSAFTPGSEKTELDKRVASALLQSGSVIFLDNANGTALRSDTLASAITERQVSIRPFGQTRLIQIKSTAWIAVTGNGLSVSEDLARRFLAVELDPRCDDPEAREFPVGRDGFLAGIRARRSELLTAALTIWRWGRQDRDTIARGKSFGSFETWASWVRDPLMSLGCADPVAAIAKAKALDPRRVRIAELFGAWNEHHNAAPMKIAELHEAVTNIADPQGRGRQYLATYIAKLSGTRAGGFVMTRQEAAGSWTGATYALSET